MTARRDGVKLLGHSGVKVKAENFYDVQELRYRRDGVMA